jgi:hypothetical protein
LPSLEVCPQYRQYFPSLIFQQKKHTKSRAPFFILIWNNHCPRDYFLIDSNRSTNKANVRVITPVAPAGPRLCSLEVVEVPAISK